MTRLSKISRLGVIAFVVLATACATTPQQTGSGKLIRPPPPPPTRVSKQSLGPSIVPALLPDKGVRITDSAEVLITTLAYDELKSPQLDGDKLVMVALDHDHKNYLAEVDLNSGETHTLTASEQNRGFVGMRFSGNHIAWRDFISATTPLGYEVALRVFDKQQNTEITISKNVFGEHDLKDNLVVWGEGRNQTLGIYAYDLQAKHEITVASGTAFRTFPRACSHEWVTFLQNHANEPHNDHAAELELHAHSVRTNEDINVGNVRNTYEANMGSWHSCDSHYVAWLPVNRTTSTEVHLYDLNEHSDRTIEFPTSLNGFGSFKDGVLLSSAAYDVERNVFFDFFPLPSLSANERIGGQITASKSKTIWLTDIEGHPPLQHLYVASVVQDQLK